MKPGTGTEFKQGLAIVENDQGPIHHPRAEISTTFKSGSNKKLITKIVLGLVALTLIVAATLTAVYLGGKITKEAAKVSWFTFRMPDGRTINEKITVTESEEDITVLDEDTRIIYDYNKGYVVMKTKDEGMNKCYISTFDRNYISSPAVDEDKSMGETNVTVLPEMDYYVQKDTVMDSAILSPRSREMCEGLPVYWMIRSPTLSGSQETNQRHKRGYRKVCHTHCKCCPEACYTFCSFDRSW